MPKTPFIDPLTGLQSPQNRNVKKPPLSEDLALSSGVLSYGPQDVGGYFETDSQFDKYIQRPDLPNFERERALMQPWHHQAFNAIVGGIASGLLTAAEVTANIGDLENHLERMGGYSHVEQNAIASYMQDSKEELAKKLPIYRESSDIIDWRDSGFYWSAVKGIIDSAVGFAIPGMGASKAVGAVQKLARISSYLNFLKTSQATSQIINSLASGYLTNLGEGMVMGVEQYENSINQLKENLLQSNITAIKDMNPDMPLHDIFQLAEQQTQQQLAEGKEKEFSEIAGEEADRFLSRNRIFMLTDAIGLHGIYKGQGFTRALIKEKGFGAAAKRLTKLSSDNLILQGFKESAEEIGQNVLQMEGEYQTRKAAGMDVSDDHEDVLSRAYKFATSEQALLEGMMGFFGGGPQRILTEAVSGNLSASAKARQAQRYQDQQSQIGENTAFLNKKLAYYTKAQAERMAAIKAGETDVADFIAKNEFVHLATENFVRGTTENLERQLQDIANGVSEQERIANGWDENYQQQAKDQLELLDKLETSYNRYSKYENQANVFANRQTRRLLQEDKERIQSLLDDVDMELSSQEEGSKDPDLLGRKKYLEKGLTDATRLINEKDVEFKDLTSAKTQKAAVDQKKKIIKDAKEISKKVEARRKKEDQERKAKERREKNETKDKAKKEQEQEKEKTDTEEEKKKPADDVDLDKVTEQDEFELSSLSDETDVTLDTSQLDDIEEAAEPDLSNMDADEAQAYEEKKQSQKEFDDLSDTLLDNLEQLATNEILIEGDDISDTQRNVGILEMMIQAAQKAIGKENITFDDIVDMLLKRHGSKRIAPLFNMIQGIYTQKKPMTNLYRNFEDYIELSETDKKELGDKKQQAKAITKEQFTEESRKELDEDIKQLEKDFSKTDEETEFDYVRVLQGHNVLAYLSRLYTQTKSLFSLKRTDVDNKINEEIQDRDILDPKKYKVGTEVSFIVEDDNKTKVYVDSSSRKEKIRITWGAKKASYQSNVVEGETERYNELYEEEVPIAVYINGKKVGYLHETSWINETNVSGDIETDRAMSKKIRKHIVEKGSYNTTISKRSNGYLWKVANNELMTTDEALPDPNMTIAVVKNGKLHENRNKPVSGIKLVNKTLKEGVSYAIVPISSTEHIALPLINKKLSESPEIASTIRRALEIFYSEDKSKEAEAFVDEIIKATQNTAEGKSGYNIRTAIGLSQYINMFIHLTDTAGTIAGKDTVTGKLKGTLQTFLEENTTNDQINDGFATSYVREGNDLQFEVSRGKGVGSRTMSKASYTKLTNDAKTKLFNEIEAILNRMYINISLDSIGDSSRNVVIVNNDGSSETRSYNNHIRQMTKSAFMGHNIAEEGESPNYVYAVQPVITFDFSEFEERNVTETTEKEKPVVSKTEQTQETKSTTSKKESPKYKKGRFDFSSTDEYLSNADPLSELVVPLGEEEIKEISDKAEVTEVGKRGITGVIISEFGSAFKQQQVTDFIRSEVVDRIFKKRRSSRKQAFIDIKQIIEEELATAKENLKLATEENDAEGIEMFTRAVKEISIIVNNWSKLEKMVSKQLERIENIKIIENEENEISEEEQEVMNEMGNYADASTFTTPSTNRLAQQIKQFLSGIRAYRQDPANKGKYVPDVNYFGMQKTMDFMEVYNVLQRITPNLEPSYEAIYEAIKQHAEVFPFLQDILVKLDNAPQFVKNQLVAGMTNHDVDMKFVQFEQNQNGSYKLTEFDADANAPQRVLLQDWYNASIDRIGEKSPDGDDILIPEEVSKNLYATWEKFSKSKSYTDDEITDWFYQIGVELTDKTWRDIRNGNFEYRGRKIAYKDFVETHVMKILAKVVSSKRARSLAMGGDRLIDENVIKALAKHDARYRANAISNSFRAGTKTVYSYSLNKFLINRMRQLKNGHFKALKRLSFNGNSFWADQFLDKESGFSDNFNRWTISLEALKRKSAKSRNHRELHNLSEGEMELVKIAMLQADRADLSGQNKRVINVFYLTTSDKTTAMGLTVLAQKLILSKTGEISNESIDTLIDAIVRPEINRITVFQKKQLAEKSNIKGYDKGGDQFLMLPEMNTLTWSDSDGQTQKMFNEDGSINGDLYSTEAVDAMRSAVREHFSNLLEEKLEMWRQNGIGQPSKDKDGKVKKGTFAYLHSNFLDGTSAKESNPMGIVESEYKVKAAATDMIFQYLIANAEMHKAFNGDPALYYKQAKVNIGKSKTDPEYNFVADSRDTYDNINKRLAADIAPGTEVAIGTNDIYTQLILKDSPSESLARFEITAILDGQEKADKIRAIHKDYQEGKIGEQEYRSRIKSEVKGTISSNYYSFDGTDAQEYTTWKEHLYILKQLGKISNEEYDNAYATLSKKDGENDLGKELLDKVMQPMKPVFVDNLIDESSDVEKRVYIKSSAFPLLPQLTRGLEIDKLRRMMESKNIDRAAFTTAIKVGGPSKAVNIWNSDGTIKDDVDITGSTLSLTRSKGFRIQQEVPYDPAKSTITKVSQASKNLLINMLDVEDFMIGDDRYNGRALQQTYHETYGRLHEIEKQKLEKRIGYDPVKGIYGNIQTLREILIEEARERNYPLSDQELMELDKELRFLAFSPSANKYESLLNSLVSNKIIRLKMHGKSYVLGSEEGFKALISDEAEVTEKITKTPGIVFTDKWTGKLLPARTGPNGERLPSQAIVPWKFKNKDDEYLDIRQYMVGDKLDMSKIPEEMLQMFGMRIPNQGPNSQAWIEIVGFLPEAQGDLIITTRDFVVQMGSDFDVDKLYTYTYSYYIDNDGVVRPHRELKSKNEEDILRNTILDVHLAIHRNPDNRVQSQIVNPLGTWELENIADEVSKLRKTREEQGGKKKQFFTGLSDSYQRRKFKEGTAGKSGVGVFSLDSMFNAVVQGKNLVFKVNSKDNLKLTIGNRTSDGNLSKETALDGKTYKSDVIAGYQSAAVDNAKDPLLDKLNINSYTFKVIKILNQLGFTHEVPYLLSQDIIVEYVSELERLSSSMSDFYGNREDEAYRRVVERYNFKEYNFKTDSKYAEEEATIENLKKYIELGPSAPNYNKAQIAILNLFRKLDEYGLKIQTLQSTINPDSASIGKSVLESQLKEEQIYKLINETGEHISNASSLIGEIKMIQKDEVEEYSKNKYHIRRYEGQLYAIKANTINGHAVVHGLFAANDMWSHLFPYRTSAVDRIFTKVEQLTGRSANRIPDRADRRKTIWNNMKSYLFTKRELGLYESNINLERERLLYDRWKKETITENGITMDREINVKESLGTFLSRVKRTPLGMNNSLLNKLSVDLSVSKVGKPTLIKYNASVAESVDESNVYVAFIDMFTKVDPKTGNSPVVGTWNGREVTLRELAQELVLYSYITGGIQEAVQFVKYIPASYLTTIPFANELGSTHFTDIEFGIERHSNPIIDYYQNLPPFVQQYIQHNPDQVPVIAMEDIERSTGNDTNTVTSFSLKPDTIDRIGERIVIENTEQMFTPVYVSIKNGKSEKGYRLFKYDYANHTYKEIDVLGSFANDEYNANTPYQRTLVRNNKAKEIIPKKSESVITQDEIIKQQKQQAQEELQKETGNPLGTLVDDDMDLGTSLDSLGLDLFKRIDSLIEGTLKPKRYDNGKEEIKKILNEIINTSTNAYYAGLAQELLSKIDILPTDVSVSYVESKLKFAGRYASFTSVAQNSIAHTVEFNIPEFKGKSPDHVAKVMLHEITHAFTIYKARYYEALMNNDEGLIKALLFSSPKLRLSKKEEEIMKSISVLRNHTFNAIVNTPEIKERFDQLLDKLNRKRDPNVKFGKNEINKLYGLTSLGEFITMATSSPEFMEILNGIIAPDQKTTVLEKIRQKLTELLNSILGFDVKEGSVFAETLRNVLELNDAITESGLANEIIEGMQEKAEGVKRETKIFKEHGTYYRFELEKDVPVKGEYSQGNTNDWKDLNVKTMTTKYSQLLEDSKKPKKEETPKELPEKVIVTDNQLELYDGTVITFNEQQVEALESMRDFLKSDERYFVLTGYAGTGKSTIVRKIVEENNALGNDKKVLIGAAPTHRAKRVLKILTGRPAETIHTILGLSLNTDLETFSLTTPKFDPINPPKLKGFDIVIIDEASMINKNLYAYIQQLMKYTKTKIIFMGDPAQIPPIGEKSSLVFTDSEITRRSNLTKVERVKGSNPLNGLYDVIRDNLTSVNDKFSHETKLNDKGEGVLFTPKAREFETEMIKVFSSEEYTLDPTVAKTIAWTNDRVKQLNTIIRTNRLGENLDVVEVGDVLTGYTNIHDGSVLRRSMIENSADYVVKTKSSKTTNQYGISGYRIELEDVYSPETEISPVFVVDTNDPANVKKVFEEAKALLNYAKAQPLRSRERGMAFGKYYQFQRQNVVNIELSYLNEKGGKEIVLSKAIDYGYAVTAHKSQGGTFKYVFIDEDNIDRNKTIRERNQIKYVSLSRASHSATVLSYKTTVEKNSYSKPVNKTITSPDPNIDLSKLQDIDVDVNQMGDQGVEGITFLPNEDQVKEFMKKCKS